MARVVVEIAANAGQAIIETAKFEKSLGALQAQLSRLEKLQPFQNSIQSVKRGEAAIEAAKQKIVAFNAVLAGGSKSLTAGSNQAAFALTNLGRVAQDAPFGFIGIQNNLNPLLESFQQLRKESGSNIGALKSLAGSLIGPAGIGLALSAVTAGLVLYTQWSQKAAKETKVLADSHDSLRSALKEGNQEAAKEVTTLRTLYEAATNVVLPIETRLKAVKKLQEEYPKTFANATKEAILNGELGASYNKLTADIIANARAKAINDRISKASAEILDQEIQKQKILNANSNENARARDQVLDLGMGQQARVSAQSFIIANNKRAEAATKAADDIIKAKQAEINLLEKFATVEERVNAITDTNEKKNFKDAETRAEKLKKLLADLAKAREDFALSVAEAGVEIANSTAESIENQLGAKLKKDFEEDQRKPIELKPRAQIIFDDSNVDVDLSYFKLIFEQFAKDVNGLLDGAVSDSAFNFGASIGQAFADGGNVIEAAGQALLGSVGSIISEFGKLLIKAGVAALALQLVLKNPLNPIAAGAAIAAGIALVAIGAAVSGFASRNNNQSQQSNGTPRRRIPGFANGVENFSGGIALVGERGPELVNLPTGSGVIPNHKISGIATRDGIEFGDIKLSGQDLYISWKRTQKLNERIG